MPASFPTPGALPRLVPIDVAEAAARRTEEELFAVLGALGDGVIVADAGGAVTRINARAAWLTGWHDALGRSLDEIYRVRGETLHAPRPRTPLEDILDEPAQGKPSRTVLITSRDERLPIVGGRVPLRGPDGVASRTLVFFRDVSDERRVEAALASARHDFQEVIEKTLDGMVICLGGEVAYANPAFTRALGYAESTQLAGRRLLELLHADERRTVANALAQAGAGGPGVPHSETRFLRADGETATLELSPVQLIQFEGASAVLLVARDLTEQKRLQARLMLSDRMVAVGTLAAGVAHEINNPLAAVIANLEVLSEELDCLIGDLCSSEPALGQRPVPAPGRPTAERVVALRETLHDAREAAERVRVVARDLKTFSRSDDSRTGRVELPPVIESSINMAWNEIRHRARLVKDYGDAPAVEANEARLGQVLLNLLVNAAQAIPEGQAQRHEIRVATRADRRGCAVVEVSDTGEGIRPEVRDRIFEPFFTTKAVGVGTGLGLSICRDIVTSFGGSIEVHSEIGRGSLFRVTLPPWGGRVRVKTAPITVPTGKRRGRILIVDDEPSIGTALARVIGHEHDLTILTSPREALDRLRGEESFDLILCDLMMPDMTGMDLHDQLLRDRPDVAARMLFVTGGAFTPRARQFLDAMPERRIDKPFDVAALRRLIAERLS